MGTNSYFHLFFNFCFKMLCTMWTSLWITYCSLGQLIIMLCGTHHVYWCNMYWVFINLETAWFAKFDIGHSKLSHQMQSETSAPRVQCLLMQGMVSVLSSLERGPSPKGLTRVHGWQRCKKHAFPSTTIWLRYMYLYVYITFFQPSPKIGMQPTLL